MLSMATALKAGIPFEFHCLGCRPTAAAPTRDKRRKDATAETASTGAKRRRNAAAVAEGAVTPDAAPAAVADTGRVGGAARVRPYRRRATAEERNIPSSKEVWNIHKRLQE